MQIKKTYRDLTPELLYHEVRDFTLKQGVVIDSTKMETYSLATDSSSFVSRGTLTFKSQDKNGKVGTECLRAHVVGSPRGEIKLIIDLDEKLFPQEKVTALQADLDFVFGSYEAQPE
ncbi:MAG: hypothetical protein QGI51_01480 [Dehalococcoidales bacterium]|jgi:hypothetical protein|nr:hypothetical protein [Dehalococcoidales bacterium]MDP6501740.1 hypothetical protein [Dehalococcoidales bacterium]MDP6632160.1 hypothetical protein [Dehalococcoidales bacterium]|tara:strand:+ start:258 stop:608 length:351 start_codon:yes stop_codon:yes gene_type:complete